LAGEYGLRLKCDLNFHAFFAQHCQNPDYLAHLQRGQALDPRTGAMPQDAWDIAYFYRVFVFQKESPGAALQDAVPVAQAQFDPPLDPARMQIRTHRPEDIITL
jgi:hypothetical protein